MKVSMPENTDFGWGVAGRYLVDGIACLEPIQEATLHCIPRLDFEPMSRDDWNAVNIGYCFFEHDILAYHSISKASRKWDFIVAGSKWCEYHLRIAGVRNTTTILQGVDPLVFNRRPLRQDDGRFIVFSGGKFEFRKGQDIVIAAMRIFMERHSDVWLSCAWHNHWEKSLKTMEQSRLIDFSRRDIPCGELVQDTLARNGIDMHRVLLHPLVANSRMADIYADSDIGLFPNRCEGGNNMVMCEYMACGRPVVASSLTGHADVITQDNAFQLNEYKPVLARLNGMESGVWFEPSVDEVVSLLENAYLERTLVNIKGAAAAESMKKLSWQDAAQKFHSIGAYLSRERRKSVVRPASDRLQEAERLFNGGHYGQAEKIYRGLLLDAPLDPDIFNCLGTVLDRQGRFNDAVAYYNKAISLRPDYAVAHYNLANTLKRQGCISESIESLKQVVSSDPDFVDAWQNLGVNYFESKEFRRAADCFERVVRLDPMRPGCYGSLGEIYYQMGESLERGLECLDIALAQQPGNVELINLKGVICHEFERYDKAEQCYREGLRLEPDNPFLISNLGNMYLAMAMPEKAVFCFNQALAIEPGAASTIFNRAMSRLLMGDFKRGWEDYEARFSKQEPVVLHHQDLPAWRGESLAGRTLLVWAEQVYGDTIQFARYLPLMGRFGGRIVFECMDESVLPLFRGLAGIDELVVRGETLPPADLQIPLVSLPRIFGTTIDTIPFPGGYLRPDAERSAVWKRRIDHEAAGRYRVGIVWGGRKPRLNSNRSMHLGQLLPLFDLKDICWFSLQTGEDRDQLSMAAGRVVDLVDGIRDFGDTAAIIAALDLVITIDTATAHLAGALGAPTWVMLKSSPDWRWLMDRSDSPWCDSVRLFRQQNPGEWEQVVASVEAALKNLLHNINNAKERSASSDTSTNRQQNG